MKGRIAILLICLIVIADQVLKIYIKTHYYIGEFHPVFGEWFKLYFIENEGMAYGWKFGGDWGKMALTLFRLGAVIYGVFLIKNLIKKNYSNGLIICACLIFAGALGNLIDSMFYGLIFENSSFDLKNVAQIFPEQGYASFLHGNVVDMLYFPIIRNATFPAWIPVWGGDSFEFFRPIFNLADASISTGIITLFIFQKRFIRKKAEIVEIDNSTIKVKDITA